MPKAERDQALPDLSCFPDFIRVLGVLPLLVVDLDENNDQREEGERLHKRQAEGKQ
jgi:hypothetical protein